MQRKTGKLKGATLRRFVPGAPGSLRRSRGAQRPASVLVLVMTLLGVLFVIGVAFLATMNFEAEMIAAQSHQIDRRQAVGAASDQVGMLLQDIFANPTGGEIPYAELPQVNSTFSPVEPMVLKDWGPDGLKGTLDDSPFFVGFSWVTDIASSSGISATNRRRDFHVDVSLPDGTPLNYYGLRCLDGPAKGQQCTFDADCQGSICRPPMLSDADGDGINDSALVLASDLGLSEQQIAAIAAQVNPPSNPGGRVFAALRVVPHGGMVHLNYAHPRMIENLFDLTAPLKDYTGGSGTNYFRHSPTQDLVFYSPLIEEALLRNRGLLPLAASSPSLLQGDPFSPDDDFAADMPFALMWPNDTSGGSFQTLSPNDTFAHRFDGFTPCALPDGDCFDPNTDLWQVRMEPFTARSVSSPVSLLQYDRRHLSTTVSHDDLLARPTTVPAGGLQRAEVLAKMRAANSSLQAPDDCYLSFEYANYPHDLPNAADATISAQECDCPARGWCSFDERKGRLKLSLPWLQRMLNAGNATLDPLASKPLVGDPSFLYVPRLIQDVYGAMLANLIPSEPTYCTSSNDCPFIGGDATRGRQGCDTTLNRCICVTSTDCQPGEYCVAGLTPGQGYCTSAANFWDNKECSTANPQSCGDGEFCDSNLLSATGDVNGLCADSWSELPRSQARLSRAAASLAANAVDFMDADLLPTRIGVRSFDFTRDLCRNSLNPGEFCRPGFGDCSSGTCGNNPPDPATVVGRDEFDPFFVYKPKYVYGLEPQPFITAISTVAEIGTSGAPELTGWAIELFNPFDHSLPQQNPNPGAESEYCGIL